MVAHEPPSDQRGNDNPRDQRAIRTPQSQGAFDPPGAHVFDNPLSGERIVIRTTGVETAGQLLVFDLFLPPGSHVPARHVHPRQEERFTVLSGCMRFRFGRQSVLVPAGETVVVSAGTAHWFGNAGPEESHARVEVRPALRMQELLEATCQLAHAGHVPGTHLPELPALATVLLEFQSELGVPHIPASVLRWCLTPFTWLRRRLVRDVSS